MAIFQEAEKKYKEEMIASQQKTAENFDSQKFYAEAQNVNTERRQALDDWMNQVKQSTGGQDWLRRDIFPAPAPPDFRSEAQKLKDKGVGTFSSEGIKNTLISAPVEVGKSMWNVAKGLPDAFIFSPLRTFGSFAFNAVDPFLKKDSALRAGLKEYGIMTTPEKHKKEAMDWARTVVAFKYSNGTADDFERKAIEYYDNHKMQMALAGPLISIGDVMLLPGSWWKLGRAAIKEVALGQKTISEVYGISKTGLAGKVFNRKLVIPRKTGQAVKTLEERISSLKALTAKSAEFTVEAEPIRMAGHADIKVIGGEDTIKTAGRIAGKLVDDTAPMTKEAAETAAKELTNKAYKGVDVFEVDVKGKKGWLPTYSERPPKIDIGDIGEKSVLQKTAFKAVNQVVENGSDLMKKKLLQVLDETGDNIDFFIKDTPEAAAIRKYIHEDTPVKKTLEIAPEMKAMDAADAATHQKYQKLQETQVELDGLKEALNQHPFDELKKLLKLTVGKYKNELPEVGKEITGANAKTIFGRYGDEIAAGLGYADSEALRADFLKFKEMLDRQKLLDDEIKSVGKELKIKETTYGYSATDYPEAADKFKAEKLTSKEAQKAQAFQEAMNKELDRLAGKAGEWETKLQAPVEYNRDIVLGKAIYGPIDKFLDIVANPAKAKFEKIFQSHMFENYWKTLAQIGKKQAQDLSYKAMLEREGIKRYASDLIAKRNPGIAKAEIIAAGEKAVEIFNKKGLKYALSEIGGDVSKFEKFTGLGKMKVQKHAFEQFLEDEGLTWEKTMNDLVDMLEQRSPDWTPELFDQIIKEQGENAGSYFAKMKLDFVMNGEKNMFPEMKEFYKMVKGVFEGDTELLQKIDAVKFDQALERKLKPLKDMGMTADAFKKAADNPTYYHHIVEKYGKFFETRPRPIVAHTPNFVKKMKGAENYSRDVILSMATYKHEIESTFIMHDLIRKVYSTLGKSSEEVMLKGLNKGRNKYVKSNPEKFLKLFREDKRKLLLEGIDEVASRVEADDVIKAKMKGILADDPKFGNMWDQNPRLGVTIAEEVWIPQYASDQLGRFIEVASKSERWARKMIDQPIAWWKFGILALSPRWYVNNLVSGIIFTVMSGGNPFQYRKISRYAKSGMVNLDMIHQGFMKTEAQAMGMGAKGFVKQTRYEGVKAAAAKWPGWGINDKMENFFRENIFFTSLERLSKENLNKIFQNNLQVATTDMAKLTKGDYDGMLTKIMSADKGLQNEALDTLKKWLPTYRVLSNPEQTILKRIFPFWNWYRHMFVLTGRLANENPRALVMWVKLWNAMKPLDNAEDLPEYIQNRFTSPFTATDEKTGKKVPLFISLRGQNPFFEIQEWGKNILRGNIVPLDQAFQSMNPLIKVAIESKFRLNTFTGREFTSVLYNPNTDQWINPDTLETIKGKPATKINDIIKITSNQLPLLGLIVNLAKPYAMYDDGTPIVGKDGQPKYYKERWLELLKFFGFNAVPWDKDLYFYTNEKKSDITKKQYLKNLDRQKIYKKFQESAGQ